jgi:cytochrome c2
MPTSFRKTIAALLLTTLALLATSVLVQAQDHGHDVDLACDVETMVAHQQEHAAALETLADDLLHDPEAALEALYTTGIAYQALALECGFDRMTEAEAAHEAEHAGTDPDVQAMAMTIGDPENGAVVFTTVQPENGFACSTCHRVDNTERLIGPGLLTVGDVGHDPSEHAEGETDAGHADGMDDHAAAEPTEEAHGGMAMQDDEHDATDATEEVHTEQTLADVIAYIRTSILHPNDFIVPGYPADLMPQNYAEILTDEEVNDLVAYLLTLE